MAALWRSWGDGEESGRDDSHRFRAFWSESTKPTNSTHWKWIKFWDSIPSWAKRTELPTQFRENKRALRVLGF
jgi:hypothetical protein